MSVSATEATQTETQPPAKPRRMTAAVELSGGRLVLRYCSRQWGRGAFLLFWMIAWTVGCVFLAGMVIRQPQLFTVLFAVPFWASWVFVFFMILKSFFQKEELVLDYRGATFVRRVFIPLKSRFVPLGEVQSFGSYSVVVNSESGYQESGIEMLTLGQPIRMAQGLSQPELEWLQFQLNEQLSELRGASNVQASSPLEPTAATVTAPDARQNDIIVLSPTTAPVSPPSDCCWRRTDGFDDFAFVKRGRLALSSVLMVVFINVFWNGIVSMGVLELCGAAPIALPGVMWWAAFIFLIPFEAIGLLMFLGLLAALLEPVHHTVWNFTRHGIELRQTWCGIGPHWSWDAISLERIELRRDTKRGWLTVGAIGSPADPEASGRCHRLSFVDNSNTKLCSITGLTKGEARWIGDVVLRERPIWFR